MTFKITFAFIFVRKNHESFFKKLNPDDFLKFLNFFWVL